MTRPMRFVLTVTAACMAISAAPSALAQQFADQTAARFPLGTPDEYTNQCSIIDIDGDNDLDIAWANGQGYNAAGAALKVRIFINNSIGNFTDQTDARTGGLAGWFRGVEFGDCDGDGDWDMILAQDFNKQPQLLINDGFGVFSNGTAARLPAGTFSSARAQFGDVDNDGDLDLALCNSGAVSRFGSGQPKLWLNNGLGFYTDATAQLPVGLVGDQQDIIFGDVDGDLDLDLHLGSRAGTSKLFINNGAGTFTTLAGFAGGGDTYSYDFGDINGDGDLDLISAQGSSEFLQQNNMPAAWTNISTQISPNTAIDDNDSKFFDYDNDGDLDFIVGSLGSTERIYRNNFPAISPQFAQIAGLITSISDASLDVKVADLTGDGKLDIITAQGEGLPFTNRIYVNTGAAGVIDNRPPTVVLTEQLPDTTLAGPFTVRTVVYDGVTSDRGFYDKGVTLNYQLRGGPVQQVPMKWNGNSLWRGTIPVRPNSGTVTYFVTAKDYNNNVGTGPNRSFNILLPCPPDLVVNRVVNVDDLLFIINNWGQPGGPADIAPPGGNGIVNVDDLLAVINGWGPCL